MLARLILRHLSPRLRVNLAAWLLVLCLVLWPLSSCTFAASEPPVVLGLSWFAIIITCLDVLCTSDVREQQRNGDDA